VAQGESRTVQGVLIFTRNRATDMGYLIIDEQRLDLEGYLVKLQSNKKFYHDRFLNGK